MRFNRQFVLAFAATVLLVLAPLVVWTSATSTQLPSKPHLPIPGREFVADYGGVGSDVAHFMYYQGLFGFGQRIRRADLYLLGTSHVQFGLSARQLSAQLTKSRGRPVVAFNLGLGCSERARFGADVIQSLDIKNKAAIADTFLLFRDATTGCSAAAEKSGIVDAAFHVGTVWCKFLWDWLLDGIVPSVILTDKTPSVTRFMFRYVVFDDWEYGGATYFYRGGEVFPQSRDIVPVHEGAPDDLPWDDLQFGPFDYNDTTSSILRRRNFSLSYTLIPYPKGGPPDRQSFEMTRRILAEARDKTTQSAFLPIGSADLTTFDGSHLTGQAATLATERLRDQIIKRVNDTANHR
jgi:hypothetical protein